MSIQRTADAVAQNLAANIHSSLTDDVTLEDRVHRWDTFNYMGLSHGEQALLTVCVNIAELGEEAEKVDDDLKRRIAASLVTVAGFIAATMPVPSGRRLSAVPDDTNGGAA